jgi:hypothetical protein
LAHTPPEAATAGLDVNALDVAASFVVQADADCTGSGLGVDVFDTQNP